MSLIGGNKAMIMIIGTGAEIVKVNFISGPLSPTNKDQLRN